MLQLEARAEASGFWRYASPVVALAITLALSAMLFVALGTQEAFELFAIGLWHVANLDHSDAGRQVIRHAWRVRGCM